jgi:hypothetical protein
VTAIGKLGRARPVGGGQPHGRGRRPGHRGVAHDPLDDRHPAQAQAGDRATVGVVDEHRRGHR